MRGSELAGSGQHPSARPSRSKQAQAGPSRSKTKPKVQACADTAVAKAARDCALSRCLDREQDPTAVPAVRYRPFFVPSSPRRDIAPLGAVVGPRCVLRPPCVQGDRENSDRASGTGRTTGPSVMRDASWCMKQSVTVCAECGLAGLASVIPHAAAAAAGLWRTGPMARHQRTAQSRRHRRKPRFCVPSALCRVAPGRVRQSARCEPLCLAAWVLARPVPHTSVPAWLRTEGCPRYFCRQSCSETNEGAAVQHWKKGRRTDIRVGIPLFHYSRQLSRCQAAGRRVTSPGDWPCVIAIAHVRGPALRPPSFG